MTNRKLQKHIKTKDVTLRTQTYKLIYLIMCKERVTKCLRVEWGERRRRLTRKLYVLARTLTATWRNERQRLRARLNWRPAWKQPVKIALRLSLDGPPAWRSSPLPSTPYDQAEDVCWWLMRDSRSLWCLLFALPSGNDRLGQMSHAHAMTPSFPLVVIRTAECSGGGREGGEGVHG